MTRTILKKKRHEYLLRKIKQNPFLKDEELAQACNVSVSTIRFDRAELGIAEYRERIKSVAEEGLVADTAVGEVLDLNLYHDGISVLKTDDTMTFDGTDIIKGQCIYAFAENLALSVIDEGGVGKNRKCEIYARGTRRGKTDCQVGRYESKRRRIYRSCCHKGKYERSIQRKIQPCYD